MILLAAASHVTLNVTPAVQSIVHIQDLDYGDSALNEPSPELHKAQGRPWEGDKEPCDHVERIGSWQDERGAARCPSCSQSAH